MSWSSRPEEQGELRVVAWAANPIGGQVIEPAIDRRRGFTAILVHVRSGSPPSPDGRRYNLLAGGSAASGGRVAEEVASPRTSSESVLERRASRARRAQQPGGPGTE